MYVCEQMSNCCPCLANGCGPDGTSGAHTITLLSAPRHPSVSLGQRDRLAAARDFTLCMCMWHTGLFIQLLCTYLRVLLPLAILQ